MLCRSCRTARPSAPRARRLVGRSAPAPAARCFPSGSRTSGCAASRHPSCSPATRITGGLPSFARTPARQPRRTTSPARSASRSCSRPHRHLHLRLRFRRRCRRRFWSGLRHGCWLGRGCWLRRRARVRRGCGWWRIRRRLHLGGGDDHRDLLRVRTHRLAGAVGDRCRAHDRAGDRPLSSPLEAEQVGSSRRLRHLRRFPSGCCARPRSGWWR